MAQKILGYVNLIWTCPFCQTQNPGAIKSCTSCGAPQPPDVQFEKVDKERFEFIKDEALIRMAKTGPDKHCPYCGTRNLGTDTLCKQCGSDISVGAQARTSGEKIGERDTEPAAAPVETPKKLSGGCLIALIIAAIIAGIILIIFIMNLTKRESLSATVGSVRWTRSIEILAYTTIQSEGWNDEIPSSAVVGYCSSKYRYTSDSPTANATEVCGEPYTVDTGTGIGEVRQDCEYRVYDDYCDYTTEGWAVADQISLSGYDLQPGWPSTSLASNEKYGNQSETYIILFNASGDQYTLTTTDVALYLQAVPGSSWELEVNGLGDVVDASPN